MRKCWMVHEPHALPSLPDLPQPGPPTSAQNSWRRRSSASHQPRVTVVSWEEGEAT